MIINVSPLRIAGLSLLIFLSAPLSGRSDVLLSGFGPETYTTTVAFDADFRKTSAGGPSFGVGTFDSQADVVRNFGNQGNVVYASEGSTSGEKTFFDISTSKTFEMDFYIDSIGSTGGSRIGVAAVSADETNSLVASFYMQSVTSTTATGVLRFEDFNFSLNDSRNVALSPTSDSFVLSDATWYRLSLSFDDFNLGVVDATVSVYSLDGRGGAVTGTVETLTLAGLDLATYDLTEDVQYGIFPGISGSSGTRTLLDGFTVVPEPGVVALFTGGLGFLLFFRRRPSSAGR